MMYSNLENLAKNWVSFLLSALSREEAVKEEASESEQQQMIPPSLAHSFPSCVSSNEREQSLTTAFTSKSG